MKPAINFKYKICPCYFGTGNIHGDYKMKITVKIKSNYGTEMIYPVCEYAQRFALIAKTKTLSRDTIRQIKQLGYSIECQQVTL